MTDPIITPQALKPSLLSQLSYFEQIRVLTTHPFFTGQCPQCKHKLSLVARRLGQCACPACGWSDQDG
ncbi:MAG: hypothetical protein WCD18_15580 [Thermosynechococcaceae cyanobacterium]